jgi:microcin C transport system substrate-binding protein
MRWITGLCVTMAMAAGAAGAADPKPVHGLAMHGAPKYPASFTHFEYVNPDAPKGGDVRLAAIGSFDSLNAFILRGVAAAGVTQLFDSLLKSADDEAFTAYGLIAETITVPADRSWVVFDLRPAARFHDGTPLTAEDVAWTLETLKTKGHPTYRSYYGDVLEANVLGPHRIEFRFRPGVNRELPLIIGQMPILSKAYYSRVAFDQTTMEPPVGSGPYRVSRVDAGRSITYQRDPEYWARDLPVSRGRFNFGTIRYDYYRDTTVAVEALKAGEYDLRVENSAKNWSTEYDVPTVQAGHLVKTEIINQLPRGMQGYGFNQRRPFFQDRRVRNAIGHAFDFEWSNKTLFYDLYFRTASYFANSELAARGLPQGDELRILESLRDKLPPEVFTTEYKPPTTDGTGNLRDNLRVALRLLREAGWEVRNNKLTEVKTGQVMEFEILLNSPLFERITLPFTRNLERLGITARVRTVDPAQYQRRTDDFDFDMVVVLFGQSLSPGNEQREFWGSNAADVRGSRNELGIKDPAIDALVELVVSAPDRDSLIQRTRALDRALLWGHNVVPHFHGRSYPIVHWNMFGRPAAPAKYGLSLDAWWVDQARLASLPRRAGGTQ